ncbi:MAG: YggT family protein, partial [Lacticaseibacillus rhamnosus]
PAIGGLDLSPILAFFVLSLIKFGWSRLFLILVQIIG